MTLAEVRQETSDKKETKGTLSSKSLPLRVSNIFGWSQSWEIEDVIELLKSKRR